jgi:hypothetical protein
LAWNLPQKIHILVLAVLSGGMLDASAPVRLVSTRSNPAKRDEENENA